MVSPIMTTVLVLAALLTALVTGLLFAFAGITMPGIRKLGDREFVRAFQVMDGIIQNNDPLFILVWAGSALLLLVASILGSVLGLGSLTPVTRIILIAATAGYFLGVQLPTMVVNIPLNNALQAVDAGSATDQVIRNARRAFEARWNRWNRRRTLVAAAVTTALLVVLVLL